MADAQEMEQTQHRYILTPREFDLLERLICVEQELKSQRDLIKMLMQQIDKRLTFMQWTIGLGFTLLGVFMALMRFFPYVAQ